MGDLLRQWLEYVYFSVRAKGNERLELLQPAILI